MDFKYRVTLASLRSDLDIELNHVLLINHSLLVDVLSKRCGEDDAS